MEEISEETKISRRFLRAIEEEHFDLLPGGVFNKNFIRQYARYLRLDEDTAVQDYLRIVGAERESPADGKNAPAVEMQSSSSGTGYFRIVVAAICLGALAVGLVYGLYLWRERKAPSAPKVGGLSSTTAVVSLPPSVPAAIAPVEGEALAATDPSRPVSSAPEDNNLYGSALENPQGAAVPPPESAAELDLRIDSVGPVWLSFTTDSGERWQGTLQAKQTKQVKASGSIHLTVGDAGAVDLSLNGNALPALGRPGEVKKITITSKGLEPSP